MPLGPLCAGHTGTRTAPQTRASGFHRGGGCAELSRGPRGAGLLGVAPEPGPSPRLRPFIRGEGPPSPHPRGSPEEESKLQDPAGALPLGSSAHRFFGVGVAFRQRPLPRPTASQRLSGTGHGAWRRDLINARARACAEATEAAHEPAPPRARVSARPHLPTSSAWRRRCVRRGLPRVLSAGAAHWSLVLEAAAATAAAAASPSAPPPPLLGSSGGGPGPELRSPPLPSVFRHLPERPDLLRRRGEHAAPFPEAGERLTRVPPPQPARPPARPLPPASPRQ